MNKPVALQTAGFAVVDFVVRQAVAVDHFSNISGAAAVLPDLLASVEDQDMAVGHLNPPNTV
jgi:hypothetical protein